MTELEIKLLNLCKGKSWEFTTDFGALIPEIIETIKAQAVSEGFVLMPKNPTEEIIKALESGFEFAHSESSFNPYEAYRAMIEAQGKK